MTIKLELPANDPIVLHEMGSALTRIAAAIQATGEGKTVLSRVETLESVVQPIDNGVADKTVELPDAIVETINKVADSIVESSADMGAQGVGLEGSGELTDETTKTNAADVFSNQVDDSNVSADIGSDGIPWDKRIHSREKTKNKDLTFKIKRKTKEFATKEEWLAFVNGVKQELITAMSAPATTENVAPPETTKNVVPPIVENVAPPATTENVAPPVVEETEKTEQPPVTTFQQLMLLITTNSKKITKDQVNKIINDTFGTTTANPVALCATRTDLIPAIAAKIMVITNG